MQNNKFSGQPVICQIFSLIPKEKVNSVVAECQSDKYYKKMNTYNQLIFMLYAIINKTPSLSCWCKNLSFLDGKLSYLGITSLPARSTLFDANANRPSLVFEKLYYVLFEHYKSELQGKFVCTSINGEVDTNLAKRFDSTTFTLFSDLIFKGAGRKSVENVKKGGVKAQTLLSFDSLVPEYIELGAAAKNDKDFLGQLQAEKDHIYVFDKGYVNYNVYQKWTNESVYFVTRMNKNAKYEIIKNNEVDYFNITSGVNVLKDQEIEVYVSDSKSKLKLRMVTYKDPVTGKVLEFLSNMFDISNQTISLLYKNRWAIEPFFKQLKQNFQLSHCLKQRRGVFLKPKIKALRNDI